MPQAAEDTDYSDDMEATLDDKKDPSTASKYQADSDWGEEEDEDESEEAADEEPSDDMEASSHKAKHDNSKDMKEKSQRQMHRPSSATSLDDMEDLYSDFGEEEASPSDSRKTSKDGKESRPAPKNESSSARIEDAPEMEETSTDAEQNSTPAAMSGHSATSITPADSPGHVKDLEASVSRELEESKDVEDEPKALKEHLKNASAASNSSGSAETMEKTAHKLFTRSAEDVTDDEEPQGEGKFLNSNQGWNATILSEVNLTTTAKSQSQSKTQHQAVEKVVAKMTQTNSTASKLESRNLEKRKKLKCGPSYCQRRGWYQKRSRFMAAESDTYEWTLMTRRIANWSNLVVEDCRWDGQPPNCGFAEEMEGDVKLGWTLVIGDRVHWREICEQHFSIYFNGKDCCEKYEYRNPCRRGYRRLWCLSKNPFEN
ncbi:hypothetical protein GQ602_005442 [Ophiocordyceps camponoti-floridani]|uniref:Uncharacterized protein n=1 Tax=Ophiocordyceps camponoti-floridani TaxID=2030778 RepID=A0A8H4Q3E9_9HYPO|nr:hypothetical protein GQ602_005442 [Ophiocordyceps camponoti-floridani]